MYPFRLVRGDVVSFVVILALLGDPRGMSQRGPVATLPSASAAESPPAKAVRFDGLYYASGTVTNSSDKPYWYYLRFYDDATVLGVSSTGTPQQVIRWFNKEHQNISRGRYNVQGDQIKFSHKSKAGVVDYEGTIQSNAMNLRSHSHINESKMEKIYKFAKVEEPAR
jgi:hypothetical protein